MVLVYFFFFFFNDTATTEIYTLSLHDALPPSELISPPNALEQFSAAGSVDVKEGRPCSAGEVLRRHLLAKSQLACIAAESNPICCGSPGLENHPGRDGRK